MPIRIRRRVLGECEREALNSDELKWLIAQKEKEETFAGVYICLYAKPCESFLPALKVISAWPFTS